MAEALLLRRARRLSVPGLRLFRPGHLMVFGGLLLPMACLSVICVLVVVAVLAPALAPHDPQSTNLAARLRPPFWFPGGSVSDPLGTDGLGYDILSRLLFGARVSLTIGLSALLIGLTLGASLGLLTGYFRGATDAVLMLLVDAQL